MYDAYKDWVYNAIFRAIKERYEEAESEFHKDINNTFKAGRALAYEEVKEIIENRLEAAGRRIIAHRHTMYEGLYAQ